MASKSKQLDSSIVDWNRVTTNLKCPIRSDDAMRPPVLNAKVAIKARENADDTLDWSQIRLRCPKRDPSTALDPVPDTDSKPSIVSDSVDESLSLLPSGDNFRAPVYDITTSEELDIAPLLEQANARWDRDASIPDAVVTVDNDPGPTEEFLENADQDAEQALTDTDETQEALSDKPTEGKSTVSSVDEIHADVNPAPQDQPSLRDIGSSEPLNKALSFNGAPENTAGRLHGKLAGDWLPVTRRIILWTVLCPVLFVLTALVSLRVAIMANQNLAYNGWESLGLGILVSLLLTSVIIILLMISFGRRRLCVLLLNCAIVVLVGYSGYSLLYLSKVNAKSEQVRNYYTSLHPLLRVAVTNLTFADDQLVVTSAHRTRAGYAAMGMHVKRHSLHYKQSTGFVHAVDVRTKGRSKIKNYLVEQYFELMGFDTLRHVGTADHLHISLPVNSDKTRNISVSFLHAS